MTTSGRRGVLAEQHTTPRLRAPSLTSCTASQKPRRTLFVSSRMRGLARAHHLLHGIRRSRSDRSLKTLIAGSIIRKLRSIDRAKSSIVGANEATGSRSGVCASLALASSAAATPASMYVHSAGKRARASVGRSDCQTSATDNCSRVVSNRDSTGPTPATPFVPASRTASFARRRLRSSSTAGCQDRWKFSSARAALSIASPSRRRRRAGVEIGITRLQPRGGHTVKETSDDHTDETKNCRCHGCRVWELLEWTSMAYPVPPSRESEQVRSQGIRSGMPRSS